jgi:release factor glutamine methyltransferase
MLICELLQESTDVLANAGIETPAIDVELLLGHCLGMSRTDLYLSAKNTLSSSSVIQFQALLSRRKQREPLAYILGVQEFWSLDFLVSPEVLIPRPETEQLLEKVIAFYTARQPDNGLLIDLCCGSGAIAVVLAKELQRKVLAIDISFEALRVAKENCEKHGVAHLVSLLQSDLLTALRPVSEISCVVSNPPYVSREEMDGDLQPEVNIYEPHLALDGGLDGLEVIKMIKKQLVTRLAPGGYLFMEIGAEQGDALCRMFTTEETEKLSFSDVSVQNDYAGHDRIFQAMRNILN